MKEVAPGATNQTLVLYAYDTNGDGVALTESSDGLTLSYRVDTDGREGTPVSMTPIARSVAGTHEDGAITSKGDGKHEVDVPDAGFAAGNLGKVVTLEAAADDVDVFIVERAVIRVEASAAGTGPRTVLITVDDGTNPIDGAHVQVTKSGVAHSGPTDASGQVTLNLSDGTWTVAIAAALHSFAGASLVVDGDETPTYSMTPVSFTPPDNPGLSALVILCVDENGVAEPDVEVDIRIVTVPSGDTNVAYKGTKQTATSDVDGLARFDAVKLAVYEYKRGVAEVWQRVTIGSGSSTDVTSFIGSP